MSTTIGVLIYKQLATCFKCIVMEVCKVWTLFTYLYYKYGTVRRKLEAAPERPAIYTSETRT